MRARIEHMLHRFRKRGEQGFVLYAALAITTVLAFGTVGLLAAVQGRNELTGNLASGHQRLRAVDSALSQKVQDIRSWYQTPLPTCPSFVGSGPYTDTVVEELQDGVPVDITVTCTSTSASGKRTIDLEATIGSSGRLGRARVQYVDSIGGTSSPGYTMIICDWRLGNSSSPLGACP